MINREAAEKILANYENLFDKDYLSAKEGFYMSGQPLPADLLVKQIALLAKINKKLFSLGFSLTVDYTLAVLPNKGPIKGRKGV